MKLAGYAMLKGPPAFRGPRRNVNILAYIIWIHNNVSTPEKRTKLAYAAVKIIQNHVLFVKSL